MSNILDVPQNFSTTLNVGGGIDNAQTSGIVLTSVTGLPTDGGMLAFDWANPINTSTIEYIEYTGLSSNTLTGVTRGQEGYTAVAHANGAKIVGVISRAHIKRLKDNFTAEHDRSTGVHNNLTVITAAQQSTPSTPSSGFDKLYFKSDDNLYMKNSAGTETQVNASTILTTAHFAPQGFLINGKIVPSVASNNLTVAIKGMDGNDPSASNPVYIRIGDTVRTITAALSVTAAAGTNWFNSGASESATKEIDYFVYLGYNATDGVVIGFSRICHATKYGDFNTTSTNDQYCKISTITNAVSTDYYELIGRFAATLSAGAAYTWTVPTFTAINLIQKPVYESRWLSWTPTYSASVGTYTSITINTAIYKVHRNYYKVVHDSSGTTATNVSAIQFTLPLTMNQNGSSDGPMLYGTNGPGNAFMAYAKAASSTQLTCLKYDTGSWANSTGMGPKVQGDLPI